MQTSRVGDVRHKVGEGPLWDSRHDQLLLVDIVGQQVQIFDAGHRMIASVDTPRPVVAVTRAEDDRLIVVLADGFYAIDPATGALVPLADYRSPPGTTFNDARVGRDGRIVAVGSDLQRTAPVGDVVGLLEGGATRILASDYILANGPCWSPDGTTFYLSDSMTRQIFAYERYGDGSLGPRRLFADVAATGMPDGATVDAAGDIWVAMCGAGRIVRFAPDGTVRQTVETPTLWCSGVAFGGAALDRLYVTSLDPAVVGIPGDELCGALFVIDGLGVTGLPERLARVPEMES